MTINKLTEMISINTNRKNNYQKRIQKEKQSFEIYKYNIVIRSACRASGINNPFFYIMIYPLLDLLYHYGSNALDPRP